VSSDSDELISSDVEPLPVAPLPVVDLVRPRIPALEVAAIATAVFALVLVYQLWVDVGAEVIWLAVLVLSAGRRHWIDSGLDLVLARRSCTRGAHCARRLSSKRLRLG
jgi:hypothetical protein